jgi:hypothetical protein
MRAKMWSLKCYVEAAVGKIVIQGKEGESLVRMIPYEPGGRHPR